MEENNRIIDYISEIAGAGVGAGIGLLVAGPVGAVGGAIASPIITNMLKWCANEAKEKRYSTREGKNIVKVLSYANSDCQYNSENSEGSFDEDWFARFINIAKDIHSDELQTIWGKILAKEVIHPHSVSLRTLDVLKNISGEEARFFQQLMPYIISIGDDLRVLPANKAIQKKCNILDGYYIVLDACGLIKMLSFTELPLSIGAGETLRIVRTSERLLSMKNLLDNEVTLKISNIYLLTQSGKELFDLLYSEPNNEYFEDWASQLFDTNNKALRFEIHKRDETKDGAVYLSDPITVFENKGDTL